MTQIPLTYRPGVCKVNSPYASGAQGGRFTDMDGMRFSEGFPEQLGRTHQVDFSSFLKGKMIALKELRTFSGTKYLIVADEYKLWAVSLSSTNTLSDYADITPLRGITTSTLSNAIDTTNGSTAVTIHHTAHGQLAGDYVRLVAGAAVGGLTIAGVYFISVVTDANTYSITFPSAATANAALGGGTTTYTYYRVTLSNPFDTTSGSPTVSVNHTAHGAVAGDWVEITPGSAVGGITPSGSVQMVSVVNANKWTFTWTSNATSTVTGGGGTPYFRYDIKNPIETALTLNIDDDPYPTWCLDPYGQQMLSSPLGGSIFIFDPTKSDYLSELVRSYPMYGAPASIYAMFVTPERFVFALGTPANALLVQWADQDDYTDWTPTANNTANSRTLQIGSRMVGGLAVRNGVSLVSTDTTVYIFNYTGDNFIYDSSVAGDNCGFIAVHAAAVMGSAAYWLSAQDLWTWDGAAQRVSWGDIRDFVVGDIVTEPSVLGARRWTTLGAHAAKAEIWGFYRSEEDGAGTNSRHFIWHTDQQCGSTGTLSRTAWIDRGIFDGPISAGGGHGSSNVNSLYFMDQSADAATPRIIDTTNKFCSYSPISIANGERIADIFSFRHDMQRQTRDLDLQFLTQDHSMHTVSTSGTYVLGTQSNNTGRIDVRFGARMVGFRIAYSGTASAAQWRLGVPSVEMQPGGFRR